MHDSVTSQLITLVIILVNFHGRGSEIRVSACCDGSGAHHSMEIWKVSIKILLA